MPNEHILHTQLHEANHCLMVDGTHFYIYMYALVIIRQYRSCNKLIVKHTQGVMSYKAQYYHKVSGEKKTVLKKVDSR